MKRWSSELHVEHLERGVFLQPVSAEFDADAGALDAAEGNVRPHCRMLVDPRTARIEASRNLGSTLDIAAPDGASEAVLAVVGGSQRVVLVVERRDGQHRAENLLLDDAH